MTTTDRPVATVHRAVRLLDVLSTAGTDLGTNELARRTGINPSTVSRLLGTLERDAVVARSPASGRYRLGPRLVEFGNAALAGLDIRRLGRPHLEELAEATRETVTLSVPYQDATITVDFVQSSSSVRSVAEIGRPSLPHATAVGKVALAFGGLPLRDDFPACTTRTITDRETLAAQLALVREQGWAQAVGEREDDLNAVAAPVLGAGREVVAVLGVQGPASRFGAAAMDRAADLLLARADHLSYTRGVVSSADP